MNEMEKLIMEAAAKMAERVAELEADIAAKWRQIAALSGAASTSGDMVVVRENVTLVLRATVELVTEVDRFLDMVRSVGDSRAKGVTVAELLKMFGGNVVAVEIDGLGKDGGEASQFLRSIIGNIPVASIQRSLDEHRKTCTNAACPVASVMEEQIRAASAVH